MTDVNGDRYLVRIDAIDMIRPDIIEGQSEVHVADRMILIDQSADKAISDIDQKMTEAMRPAEVPSEVPTSE